MQVLRIDHRTVQLTRSERALRHAHDELTARGESPVDAAILLMERHPELDIDPDFIRWLVY